MGPLASVGARSRVVAVLGALAAVLAIYSGAEPGPLLASFRGSSVSAIVVFAALAACGMWVLRRASASAWRWATVIGVVATSAQVVGMSLRLYDGLVYELLAPGNVAWVVVHWLGTVWLVTAALAALIAALDAYGARGAPSAAPESGRPGVLSRLIGSLTSSDVARRRRGILIVSGILVVARVPYLLVYWPGIVFFDTFRSLAYGRGTSPWETYEPVGHSIRIVATDWLGTTLGLGDTGVIAIASLTQIILGSAAFTFLLVRIAVWGVHRALWAAAFAWLALHPIFGVFSVSVVKDVPFSIAMLVFLVAVGELSLGDPAARGRRWPWVTLVLAAIAVVVTRNNGIYVAVLSLLLLAIVLRTQWKPILGVLGGVMAAYALYVGPVYTVLDVQPGPKEEAYSVPIQQLGRIAKYESASLDATDRAFMTRVFGESPEELGTHYVPELTDPMKLKTRDAWDAGLSTTDFVAGWARIVLKNPVTTLEATLANTMGYWDPQGASYDGLSRWSDNDIRDVRLDIPSGEPTSGIAAVIEDSGVIPTRDYLTGTQEDGYRVIPLLGLVMSPGFVVWSWVIACLLVVRTRRRAALAVFLPAGVLLLSFLAGPVSGGQRYSLTLYMAFPLAAAAVVLAARPLRRAARETEPVEAMPSTRTAAGGVLDGAVARDPVAVQGRPSSEGIP